MQKIRLIITTILLTILASVAVHAQETKKPDQKPQTTTLDAWRQAFPQNEVTTDTVETIPAENEDKVESAAEIQAKITSLEKKLAAAVKGRDAGTLSYLLADDFMPVGENITNDQSNKLGYIDWVSNNPKLKSYDLENINVRVYGSTAVATIRYKQTADSSADGNMVATDVWVKRGDLWQVVSHHTSRSPKTQ
ncbi:MAG: nuclear transport factor 2 family protein [Aridibacter sp.]